MTSPPNPVGALVAPTTPSVPGNLPSKDGLGQALITTEKPPLVLDGLTLKDGTIYQVKEGRWLRLEKEVQLGDGIVARPDGNITGKDGNLIDMWEGLTLTEEGKFVRTPLSTDMKAPPAGDKSGGEMKLPPPRQPGAEAGQLAPEAARTNGVEPSKASPTGAIRNMAPVRGMPETPPASQAVEQSVSAK